MKGRTRVEEGEVGRGARRGRRGGGRGRFGGRKLALRLIRAIVAVVLDWLRVFFRGREAPPGERFTRSGAPGPGGFGGSRCRDLRSKASLPAAISDEESLRSALTP